MSLKAPMRKVIMSVPYPGVCAGDAVLLHLECGHAMKFTKRAWNSRVSKKTPTKKQCYDCARIAEEITSQPTQELLPTKEKGV